MLLSALLTSKAAAAAVGAVLLAGTATAAVAVPVALGASDDPSVTATDTTTGAEGDESTADDPTTGSDDASDGATDDATDDSTSAAPQNSAAQGPDATGPAAYGLCTAWAHGGLTYAKAEKGNPAAKALVTAAAEGTVEDYCTTVLLDKKGIPSPSDTATDAAKAQPSEPGAHGRAVAASKKAEHGKPSDAGKPSDRGQRP